MKPYSNNGYRSPPVEQIAVAVVPDQIGHPVPVLYALLNDGSVWKQKEGDEWVKLSTPKIPL